MNISWTQNISTNGANSSARNLNPPWVNYRLELTLWYVIMMSICAMAALLSLVLIVTISSSRKLRSGSGLLIVNLLAVILFACAVVIPLSFTTVYDHTYSDAYCQGVINVYLWIFTAVDWADFFLCMNRFVAICFPLQYPRTVRKTTLIIFMCMTWIGSLLLQAVAAITGVQVMRTVPSWNGCSVVASTNVITAFATFQVYIPTVGCAVAYVIIFVVIAKRWWSMKMKRSANVVAAVDGQEAVKVNTSFWTGRYRKVVMSFLGYLVYTTCLMPLPLILAFSTKTYATQPVVQLILKGLVVFGYLFIPVVFFSLGSEYQKQLAFLVQRRLRGARPGRLVTDASQSGWSAQNATSR